jgi:hypothetical protein
MNYAMNLHQKIVGLRLRSIVNLGTWHLFIDKHVAHTNHKLTLILFKSMVMSIKFIVTMNILSLISNFSHR